MQKQRSVIKKLEQINSTNLTLPHRCFKLHEIGILIKPN